MKQLHLFDAYGVELEYMLVNRDSLEVMPIADQLLEHVLGNYGSDFENGLVTWSNELVLHVVELKSSKPESDFLALEAAFVKNVGKINDILGKHNAMLMPSAAHPFMDPLTETMLWPHDNNDVYAVYNKIFDCRGHGWSNLQSTHLNLPFTGEDEFAKLHAAIRVILPLLPALCASSPVLDGRPTGYLDTRLTYYKNNQGKIPSITGKVIPEPVFTLSDYKQRIYDSIAADIASFDPDHILDPIWVNSRAAIPRFDRGSIEIRIMDIQECPGADLAVVTLVNETLKALVKGEFFTLAAQQKMNEDVLLSMLDATTKDGGNARLSDRSYVDGWGAKGQTANDLWRAILEHHRMSRNVEVLARVDRLEIILEKGSLSQRLLLALGTSPSRDKIKDVYRRLSQCLAKNEMFT